MGKIGEEITQKIKSAVKAKLIELGIEVDNELPDYIMVLVANKKTQSQMEKDLQLFLGPNTVLFTTWLLNVLKKLEEVTVSKKNYKRIEVTNQEGSLVVTKKEEDSEKRPDSKKPVKVKVEPGANDSETNEEFLDIRTTDDIRIDEDSTDVRASIDQETNSSENEDSENQSKIDDCANQDPGSPDHSVDNENVSNDEESSQGKSSCAQGESSVNDQECSKMTSDQDDESNDENVSNNDKSDHNRSLDSSSRPKIMFGIREQIDEVMEKTINGNRRLKEDRGKSTDYDDKDDKRKYDDSDRLRDDRRRSLENDFYDRRKQGDDHGKGDSRRSPDDFNRTRDARRRSPDNRRRTYDDHRRSPVQRRRVTEYTRRSPEMRRRSPFSRRRSPDDRRRSPFDRRRSPNERRRSPEDKRRSPDDRRRPHDDRGRRDDHRRSPDDRSKLKILDAREILKRKTNRNDGSLAENSSNEDSHRSEKRRKTVSSLVHKPEKQRERSVEPQLPSLVRVTPRPVRKEAIQPNKKLLLLAVADAEKSVSRPRAKRQERHTPPPSSSHSSRKRELPKLEDRKSGSESLHSNSGYVPPEKIFVTLKNNQKYSQDNDSSGMYGVSREVSARKLYNENDLTLEDELMYEETYFDFEQDDADAEEVYTSKQQDEYVPLPLKEKNVQTKKSSLRDEPKCIITLESSPERSCDEWEELLNQRNEKQKLEGSIMEKSVSPPHEVADTFTVDRSDETIEWNKLGPAPIATVKPLAQGPKRVEKFKGEAVNKALERCKFWPSCLSETCIYFHPSSTCKMFPLCKSGKECLFIHPDCKFGEACLNPKCSFIHRPIDDKKKAVEVIAAPIVPTCVAPLPVSKPSPLVKCVYFPKCKNLSCKFWHPVKNCKYGRTCARSDCYFFHPTLVIPPKGLLTWSSKI